LTRFAVVKRFRKKRAIVRENAINRNATQQLGRDVETFLEIQRSRIRRPGEGPLLSGTRFVG